MDLQKLLKIVAAVIGVLSIVFLISIISTGDDAIKADYNSKVAQTKQLMMDKNHDYGEAWRDMRVSSLTCFKLHHWTGFIVFVGVVNSIKKIF